VGYDKHTPHLEKLHTVYKDYQDVLPSFSCDSFARVVLSFDRPHFFSKYPVNDSTWAHNSRVSFVYNLLVKKPKKKKRRKWWPKDWCRSQKWMKQYEPEKKKQNPSKMG